MEFAAQLIALAAWFVSSPTWAESAQRFDPATACAAQNGSVPLPLARPAPRFPTSQLELNADGWVLFMLTVAKDGTVRDLTVLDSVGGEAFREAARTAVANWRYPTMHRGRPAPIYGVRVDTTFIIDDASKGSSPELIAAVARLKAKGTTPEAFAELERAQTLPLNLSDRTILSFALALVATERADSRRGLYHIRHATIDTIGQHIGKDLAARTMRYRVEREIDDGNLRAALCLYEGVKALGVPAGANDKAEERAAEALTRMNAPEPMNVPGLIFDQSENELGPVWIHELTRPNFSLADVAGALDKARLICPSSVEERPAAGIGRWRLPDGESRCSLIVTGAAGTKFNLIEEW